MKKLFAPILAFALAVLAVSALCSPVCVAQREDEGRAEVYSLFCELSEYEIELLERAVEATAPDGSFALRV